MRIRASAHLALVIIGASVFLPVRQPNMHVERWRDDLQVMEVKLPVLHSNLFAGLSEEEFHDQMAALENDLPKLKDSEIIVRLMQIVTSVRDAHTYIDDDSTGFRSYPLALFWVGDGFHVMSTTREHADILGARLTGIGDSDVPAIMEKLSTIISHENISWLREMAPDNIVEPEVLGALGIVHDQENAQFSFVDSSGQKRRLILHPLAANADPQWVSIPRKALRQKHPEFFYWFEYLKESRTLYVKYSRCANMDAEPFARFNKRLFAFLDSHPTDRLIVDLRRNYGGDSSVIGPFLKEVSKRPSINKKGHLFVLIGSGTFSSGVIAAFDLKDAAAAIVLGEASGGRPNFFAEVKSFELPNSHLIVRYSSNYIRLSDSDAEISLQPDIEVPLSWADYVSGNDPVLDRAINFQSRKLTIPAVTASRPISP